MAIAYDAVSTGTTTATTTGITVTHTCSGSDRAAIVVVAGVRNNTTDWSWDSVTYDSVAMTQQLTLGDNVDAGRDMRVELWTLLDPGTTASASVEATISGVTLLSSSIAVITLAGVSGVGTSNSADGVSTAPTVTLTTTVENSWLVGGVGAFEQSAATGTPGTGVTERWDFEAAGDYAVDDHNNMGGHRACTTTGGYAFAYTIPDSDDWFVVAVEMTPVPTATTGDEIGADFITNNFGVSLYG